MKIHNLKSLFFRIARKEINSNMYLKKSFKLRSSKKFIMLRNVFFRLELDMACGSLFQEFCSKN